MLKDILGGAKSSPQPTIMAIIAAALLSFSQLMSGEATLQTLSYDEEGNPSVVATETVNVEKPMGTKEWVMLGGMAALVVLGAVTKQANVSHSAPTHKEPAKR